MAIPVRSLHLSVYLLWTRRWVGRTDYDRPDRRYVVAYGLEFIRSHGGGRGKEFGYGPHDDSW